MDIVTYALCKGYTNKKIASLSSGMEYKGSVDTYDSLPITGNKKGDVYTVSDAHIDYVWSSDSESGSLTDWEQLGGIVSTVLTLDAEQTTKQIKDIKGNVLTFSDVYSLISDKTKNVVLIVSECIACYPVAYDGTSVEFTNLYKRDDELYVDRVIINNDNDVLYEEDIAVLEKNLKTINGTSIYNVDGGDIEVQRVVDGEIDITLGNGLDLLEDGTLFVDASTLVNDFEGDDFVVVDLDSTNSKVKVGLDTDYQPHIVELSGTSGTLSETDYLKLCGVTSSYTAIILIDGEFYHSTSEKEDADTYSNFYINGSESILKTISISKLDSSKGQWSLTTKTIS